MSSVAPPANREALLSAVGLEKSFSIRRGLFGRVEGYLPAVRGVSFDVAHGETLGLVGESGSGKTTIGRLIARLEEADGGEVRFDGEDWLSLSGSALRRRRGKLQVVFQDPQTSLNPRMSVGDQIAEPLRIHRLARGRAIRDRIDEMLSRVGLSAKMASRFPAELSGGERQRVAIARALATRPKFLVCDEPVSSLDVSIAAQIANLLLDLREQAQLSYLFISHDLAVVCRLADRIAVLYLGRVVEEGPVDAVAVRPLHPYTVALVSAAPEPPPASRRHRIVLAGDPPSATNPPSGCPFHPRCPIARERCREERPELLPAAAGQRVACFYPGEMR
ncbi:MAG TPA: oligopeptide/dipeptide ABC transporter ATP-binding protein [Thermoanaerobaculia bacterium]|jgi:oligopeptide/dipeptide ABC transporter ATP-binding protein